MSYKGLVEDKDESPLPRSLSQLQGLLVEVQGAIRAKRVSALPTLLEELQSQRRRCNAEQISLGRVGAPAELFVAYADTLNRSMELHAEGAAMLDPNSVVRYSNS